MAASDRGAFPSSKTRHGTPSGFRLHQQRDETPCDSCKRAKREYDQRRRSAPTETLRSRRHARAQGRAQTRLRQLHPEDYARFYSEELSRAVAEDAEDDNT